MTCHKKLKRQRARLFEAQKGLCYWCNEPMVMPPVYPKQGMPPANYCTVGHLRDRLNPRRQEPNFKREKRRVAACSACNQERGQAVLRAYNAAANSEENAA